MERQGGRFLRHIDGVVMVLCPLPAGAQPINRAPRRAAHGSQRKIAELRAPGAAQGLGQVTRGAGFWSMSGLALDFVGLRRDGGRLRYRYNMASALAYFALLWKYHPIDQFTTGSEDRPMQTDVAHFRNTPCRQESRHLVEK